MRLFVLKLPVLAASMMLSLPVVSLETDCYEPETVAGWQALLDKHPTDNDLKEVYHLRLSLCQQVESDSLGIEEAAQRFEAARQRIIEKWESQNNRRRQVAPEDGQGLAG